MFDGSDVGVIGGPVIAVCGVLVVSQGGGYFLCGCRLSSHASCTDVTGCIPVFISLHRGRGGVNGETQVRWS